MSDERNARRRQRYAEDDEYRDRIKRVRRERYYASVLSPPLRDPRKLEPDAFVGDTPLFSDAKLAYCLHKSAQTIRLWVYQGFIPDTHLKEANGSRLYTIKMIEDVIDVLGIARRVKKDPAAYEEIEQRWSEMT